uniref:30S ribosomal protein S2 n=1 Tax=Nephromyces sp. ex Molgula occidentalis TaxID=2544991 RepID=A0A5C1H8B1_9APIC|nr:30S ribosomal protein S2 [Nephromyces sp. ex Molgula occidentalis]
MILITLQELINSGVQLGNTFNLNIIKKNKFIYKKINNICIIDLIQTSKLIWKLYIFLYKISFYNKKLLIINSNKLNKFILKKFIKLTKQFYITEHFISGTFTNWIFLYNNILFLNWLNIILNIFKNLNFQKKISYLYNKLNYKFKNFKGLQKIPNIIFILNPIEDKQALKEAFLLKKIIISIIDMNYNPLWITFPIPGNNINYFSIKLILEIITTSLLHGQLKNYLFINNLNE